MFISMHKKQTEAPRLLKWPVTPALRDDRCFVTCRLDARPRLKPHCQRTLLAAKAFACKNGPVRFHVECISALQFCIPTSCKQRMRQGTFSVKLLFVWRTAAVPAVHESSTRVHDCDSGTRGARVSVILLSCSCAHTDHDISR